MHSFKLNYKNLISAVLALCIIVNFVFPIQTFARTIQDIENEIKQKENELNQVNSQLEEAQVSLNNSTNKKNSAQGKLQELSAEIEFINSQIEFNKAKTKVLEESILLKNLEKEERDRRLDEKITESYLYWQSEGKFSYTAVLNSEDPVKTGTYYGVITGNEKQSLEKLATELNSIKTSYDEFQIESKKLTEQITALQEEQKVKQAEIDLINQTIAAESSRLSASKSQADKTKSQIDQLSEEQRTLKEYEDSLIKNGGGGTQPIMEGQYYFSGRGRDGVQGHGIGFSQNGALGAALAGWSYRQIIEFYYPGATITTYTARTTLSVQGYGEMDTNTYSAGLGEVPSYGCENLGVNFGDVGYWGCWPKEAIKAQVVAARTYAINYTQNGSSICTSAVCQVYSGGNAKQWAADETSYEVVSISGEPIKAYYSAQNNQGGGTANNETVWSNREGNGTSYSYLRSANDNAFYYPATFSGCGNSDCAKWGYRTNSYDMQTISSMLSWSITAPSSSITQGDRTFLTSVLNDIGTLTAITFEKDPSGRVHRIIFTGDKGSRKMAGWFFKALWNIWVSSVRPSGQEDYIYSLSFGILRG